MKLTIYKASTELGISRETLERRLLAIGVQVKPAKEYTLKEIFRALSDNLKYQRERRESAEADIAEVEAELKKKTVITNEDCAGFIRNTFSPCRELVVALPGALASLCNPSDPAHAREHLKTWSDMFLKHCKEHLPPTPKKNKKR